MAHEDVVARYEHDQPSLWKGALTGMVAGAVAGYAMEQAQTKVMPKVKKAVKAATGSSNGGKSGNSAQESGGAEAARRGGSESVPMRPPEQPDEFELNRAGGPAARIGRDLGQQAVVETHRPERERRSGNGGGQKRKSEPATAKAAEAVSENLFGHELDKEEKKVGSRAAHYAMSVTTGLIYGIAAEYEPRVTVGHGTAYGVAVWAVADEMMVPALGLSKPPFKHSLETHVYALASHLAYGAVLETVRGPVRNRL